MIDDPDDPNYRYPELGERYWHIVHESWVVVREALDPERARQYRVLGEVAVTVENTGKPAVVKLHNLEEAP